MTFFAKGKVFKQHVAFLTVSYHGEKCFFYKNTIQIARNFKLSEGLKKTNEKDKSYKYLT